MTKPEPVEEKQDSNKSELALPDFERPPIAEVAISIQFEPLEGFTVPKLGMLWSEFREEFPITEDAAPINPVYEVFGVVQNPKLGMKLTNVPPLRRSWFLNEAGTELLQIQEDRFIRNWRKRSDEDEYPRYKKIINDYIDNYKVFEEFLVRESISLPMINQCEITYVNPIVAGKLWEDHSQLSTVLTSFKLEYSDSFLPAPENVSIVQRFIIPDNEGEPLGRLHIAVDPVTDPRSGKPAYLLKLIARGKPRESNIDSAIEFFNMGHEWIVRGFTSATTKVMHDEEWRRQYDS